MLKETRYFFLDDSYVLHKGKTGYAIYDLAKGGLLAVEPVIGTVLELCEKAHTLKDISEQLKQPESGILKILDDVQSRQMGSFYPTRVFIDKYCWGSPRMHKQTPEMPPVISRFFLEVSGKCTRNCGLCKNQVIYPCNMCSMVEEAGGLALQFSYLSRMLSMDCRNLIVHGGDPCTDMRHLEEIVHYCRSHRYAGNIVVVTNGDLIDKSIINCFVKYNLQLMIPIFPTVVTNPGEQAHLLQVSKWSAEYRVPLAVTAVLDSSEELGQEQKRIADTMKPWQVFPSIVVRGDYSDAASRNDEARKFVRVNAPTYYSNQVHHPCLFQTIALAANGDLLPCPHMRSAALGNMRDACAIDNLFADFLIDSYWNTSLSNIDTCHDCEFQFGCLDCRAYEMHLGCGQYEKSPCSTAKRLHEKK